MPRRTTRPRRETIRTRGLDLADINVLFCSIDPAELERTYGSLELSRERYDHLQETGQATRRPGMLHSDIWWLTSDFPDELRRLPDTPDPDIAAEPDVEEPFASMFGLDDTLELNRFRWLAETGRLTDDDLAETAKTAALSPNFRRVQRIVAAVALDHG